MIPFASFEASGRSQSLNASRLINLFPEKPVQGSRSELVLRATPGLMSFSSVGTGPIRGMHVMNSTLFVVSGTSLYSVASDGTATLLGSSGTITGTGFVDMASNANSELVIINSSGTGWVWDTSTLASISSGDADFGDDASSVTFLDQYLIYGRVSTGQVFISDTNNAKSYNALAFGTAEYAPDNVVQVFAHAGQLWVFGDYTTEVWYNSGASPMPFLRIGGAVLTDIGGTAHTAAAVDQNIYWRGADGIVYRATGVQPQRISTHEIENRIKDWTNFRGFAYKDEGHAFYVLTATEGCVVYDAATNLWHERNTFSITRWRASCYARCYSKHLVGDYLIGTVYEMSLANYADGSVDLQRRVISRPIEDEGRRISIPRMQVHFEHGKGLTSGQGSDPQVILDWSDDGGMTWSNEHWAAIGKIGEYEKRAIWRRLGSFRQRVFRLTFTDPTIYSIYGASL